MGIFSNLKTFIFDDESKQSPSAYGQKYIYHPDFNFGVAYMGLLALTIPTVVYLRTGKLYTTSLSTIPTAMIWYSTKDDLNWHRIRVGNYMAYQLSQHSQKLAASDEYVQERFKRKYNKDAKEYTEKLIETPSQKLS